VFVALLLKAKEREMGEREEGSVVCTKGRRREIMGGGGGWSPLVGMGKRDGGGMCKNLIGFGDLWREKEDNRIRK
jgi:hypothetical protein